LRIILNCSGIHTDTEENAIQEFIGKHRDHITGVLSGFDRLVFRGTLRSLSHTDGMLTYLAMKKVLLKDFGRHLQQVSEQLKQASLVEAGRLGRPVQYLDSNDVDKEALAKEIATQDGIRQGLIGVLSCVELCRTFEVHRSRDQKQLELIPRWRKCLFLYHYSIHPRFGLMHARIQTWFPFPIQVCLNGREWLAQQMQAEDLEFVRQDNCFPWVQDWARAQRLLDAQLRVNWATRLDELAQQLNPAHAAIFQTFAARYYWTTYQSEWATDVVFRRRRRCAASTHGCCTTRSPSSAAPTLCVIWAGAYGQRGGAEELQPRSGHRVVQRCREYLSPHLVCALADARV
jgi:hypothetical protein